jgi:hypothetical protein
VAEAASTGTPDAARVELSPVDKSGLLKTCLPGWKAEGEEGDLDPINEQEDPSNSTPINDKRKGFAKNLIPIIKGALYKR